MKVNEFTFKDGKMLMWRLGNMNSNKQKHWGDPEHRQPPTKRGIWAFPYPHYDLFFCFHQWEQHLPNKFQHEGQIGVTHPKAPDFTKATREEADAWVAEYDELMKKIRKQYRPTTFWYAGEFYSHIAPKGFGGYTEWFWWDSVRDWSKVAMKHLYYWEDSFGEPFVNTYSKDHLELFIPNY